MSLKTPSNQLTDKEIHNLVELWRNIICFHTNINEFVDDNYTYLPTPNRFREIRKNLEQHFNKQKTEAKKILDERPKFKKILGKVEGWLDSIYPASTGSHETDPVRKDLNSLRAVFELDYLHQRIKTLGEILDKNYPLPRIDEVKVWYAEIVEQYDKAFPKYPNPNNVFLANICFIKEETGGNLTFVFQLPVGGFVDLDHYLFCHQGVFYETKGYERVDINKRNVIVHCERSIFWNGYAKLYTQGFSGVIVNSPLLTPKDDKCACPPFVNSTNTMEFEFAWQPDYSLWRVSNPLGSPKSFTFKGRDLQSNSKDLGFAFISHSMEKITDPPSNTWKFTDTIYYLLPRDYEEGKSKLKEGQAVYQEYIKSNVASAYKNNGIQYKPLGEIRRKHETKNQTLLEVLTRGFNLKLKDGQKEPINLNDPQYRHLQEHISVQFYFNDKEHYSCRLDDLDLKNIEINISANPAHIVYKFSSKRISFKFSEQTKLIMEASKIMKGLAQLGLTALDMAAKWFGGKTEVAKAAGDGAASVISEWNKSLESNTVDSKSGKNEMQGNRKSQMSGLSIPDTNAQKRYPYRKVESESKSNGRFSSSSEGTSFRQGKTVGQGDTARSTSSRNTTVSYSFSPAQAVTGVLGTIPSMMATSHLDNDYTLLDFLVNKKSPALKMRFQYNKQLLTHYVKNLRMRRKEGYRLENQKSFALLLNEPGFHKYIPHMVEGDTNGFFTDIFSRGVELYKTTPKEIWTLDLGNLEVPKDNMIITALVGSHTVLDNDEEEISATDSKANQDGRVWVNYESFFYKEGELREKEGKKRFANLIEKNYPKTGYRYNYCCNECKRNGRATPRQCAQYHEPEDTQHSEGDVMFAHTTDQSTIFDEKGYIDSRVKYWKIVQEVVPADEGTWEEMSGGAFPFCSSRDEAEEQKKTTCFNRRVRRP